MRGAGGLFDSLTLSGVLPRAGWDTVGVLQWGGMCLFRFCVAPLCCAPDVGWEDDIEKWLCGWRGGSL